MKQLKPTDIFYQNFSIYRPTRRCKECKQKIKSKRPKTKFYLVGVVKGNPNMIKVQITGRKTIWALHKHFFEPI